MKLSITICVSLVLINKLYSKRCCSQVIVSTGADKSKTLFEDIDGKKTFCRQIFNFEYFRNLSIFRRLQ